MESFLVETERLNIKSANGKDPVHWIVRAPTRLDALRLVAGLRPRVVDHGAHLDPRVEKLGIMKGGARQV